ncbi:MAG TPA: VOC family protein, partial [Streptosporangiaceae bacterium]|nr:VOC family protein [Streptosporangiaceae bacterium]
MKAHLDHVVIWVKDANASIDFYETVVGLPSVRASEFHAGEAPFPSVRVSDDSIIDLMPLTSIAGTERLTKTPDSAGHP